MLFNIVIEACHTPEHCCQSLTFHVNYPFDSLGSVEKSPFAIMASRCVFDANINQEPVRQLSVVSVWCHSKFKCS